MVLQGHLRTWFICQNVSIIEIKSVNSSISVHSDYIVSFILTGGPSAFPPQLPAKVQSAMMIKTATGN